MKISIGLTCVILLVFTSVSSAVRADLLGSIGGGEIGGGDLGGGMGDSTFNGSMVGSQVTGYCTNTLPICTPQNITQATNYVSDRITRVGQSLRQGQQQQVESISQLFQDTNKNNHQYFRDFGAAQARERDLREYGDGALPTNACGGRVLGSNLRQSRASTQETSKSVYQNLAQRSTQFGRVPADGKKFKREIPQRAFDDGFLPMKGTFTEEEVRQRQDLAWVITDPQPPSKPTEAQENTPQGRRYKEVYNEREAKMLIPRQVYADAIAARSPQINASGLPRADKIDRSSIVNGKLSPMVLFEHLSYTSRYANEDWHREINVLNEAGLLRELVLVEALQLEVARRQLEYSEKMALMMAHDQAKSVADAYRDELSKAYANVVNAKQGP